MVKYTLKSLRLRRGMTEVQLANTASLSRLTLRQLEAGTGNPTVNSLRRFAAALDRDFVVIFPPRVQARSELSVVAVSMKVERDGFESWPIHFMEFVDEFRATLDPRLSILPPVRTLDRRLQALLSSMVVFLCEEIGSEVPGWAHRVNFLDQPWFLSETESLKAMAIKESPLAFRRNNIFVHDNFLSRA